ncbi:TIGR03087 family PEP-CTERM/XrtA system glycosyltransferase [Colwellia sp. D2M02]|uniref:TIGR03087 family PEP-CTERM/XrtA system glycosyltransferase n=1 Tax=Colwellia sp. D2M02 TaxID=2841562 RepID=UPI001C08BF2F|nr:TIGR03087 family PEP-CTERM/XrtA system glycosyltransferase [Colwellia sp. D2M02]MBU2894690.1 TIGR03087 family PEP-CTERM/XrtA system glycosyltransferase [Colwellia sp. D2M02]
MSNESQPHSTNNKVSVKEPLLFLCHRIPFPPNKGDKIRSFNILKKLSETYAIHLGCFIDDPFDKQYVDGLNKYCASVFHLDQNKTFSKIKGLSGFFTGKPITLPYYYDKRMAQWTSAIVAEHKIAKVFVYSSSMAQYCQESRYSALERVIDFVDVDSDKWRQYAQKKQGVAKWFFNREYRLLAQVEDEICAEFSHSLFVSPDEAALFSARQPIALQKSVHGVLNGVDIDFFDPQADFSAESPVPTVPFISFTGAMDYWANVDAVLWFVKYVWPFIIAKNPQAIFCIVGGNPSSEVLALADQPGIVVTGRVHDIRPFIAKATCVVAPLQIARGIQNKVLEAMSLNKAIVVTTMAMEGINAKESSGVVISDEASVYAQACLKYLNDSAVNLSNRQWIIDNFTWENTLQPLQQYFSAKDIINE